MAFDHHVEADNVDLSFGSIMSRAPVIGSLMYLLGGRKACEEQEYESNTRKEMIDYAMAGSQCMTSEPNRPIKSALKKCSVSLIPTEYSEIGDSSSQLAVESDRMDSQLSFFPKKKELSWSDQSGQNLVEYIGPEQLVSRCGALLFLSCVLPKGLIAFYDCVHTAMVPLLANENGSSQTLLLHLDGSSLRIAQR